MNATGIIHLRTTTDQNGYSRVEIDKLVGGPYFEINCYLLPDYKVGDKEIVIYGYRMCIIERKPLTDTIICVSKNRHLWRWYRFIHNSSERLKLIYWRIIATMQIWNLAHREPGAYPSWRDINLVRKFTK